MRRAFQLAEEDEECLAARGLPWEAVIENGTKWLIFPHYPIPEGYNHSTASAALRIKPSYPDDDIDMVYFFPALALTNGRAITQLTPFPLDGKPYQQWSRHRTPANPWRPGLDNVCTHLLQVDNWLERELKK
jgi:Prokaryotic E2 family E